MLHAFVLEEQNRIQKLNSPKSYLRKLNPSSHFCSVFDTGRDIKRDRFFNSVNFLLFNSICQRLLNSEMNLKVIHRLDYLKRTEANLYVCSRFKAADEIPIPDTNTKARKFTHQCFIHKSHNALSSYTHLL